MLDSALDKDIAVVLVDDPPGDGEAQARATGVTTACRIRAVEALEDVGKVIGWDPDAGVPNGQDRLRGRPLQLHRDGTLGQRILEAVVQQLQKELLQPVAIPV